MGHSRNVHCSCGKKNNLNMHAKRTILTFCETRRIFCKLKSTKHNFMETVMSSCSKYLTQENLHLQSNMGENPLSDRIFVADVNKAKVCFRIGRTNNKRQVASTDSFFGDTWKIVLPLQVRYMALIFVLNCLK